MPATHMPRKTRHSAARFVKRSVDPIWSRSIGRPRLPRPGGRARQEYLTKSHPHDRIAGWADPQPREFMGPPDLQIVGLLPSQVSRSSPDPSNLPVAREGVACNGRFCDRELHGNGWNGNMALMGINITVLQVITVLLRKYENRN